MTPQELDLAVTQGMPVRPGTEGRFLPGSVVEKRYRIVALAGRGGMGEVYRADDLKLGQPVALKFLPAELERDAERLQRLIGEVRVARQVSHPNVCRVHDVGEFEGHHFITMEYVDGEDLAALLTRIGRLPQEKAIDLARQMAAGLAAAHAEGIVHRDLKPANVMLDGRGRARITDFGLAAAVEGIGGAEAQWGTPAYMAPEQLQGGDITPRTDVYALGLVLYEMFTGRRAFAGASVSALVAAQRGAPPSPPSSFVSGLPSLVDGAILRCLEPDAARRPASATEVLALLPGGDPLAAALRAGETPSPEMVAGAGRTEALPAAQALGLFALALLTTAFAIVLGARDSQLDQLPVPRSPDALREQAHTIVQRLGGDASPRSTKWWFGIDRAFANWWIELPSPPSIDAILPTPFRFDYRQSPHPLIPQDAGVSKTDPKPEWAGEVFLALDASGALLDYSRIPRQLAPADSIGAAAVDWSRLLALTGRDPSNLVPTAPIWTPDVASDARAAWLVRGTHPPIRLEGAAWKGRPVWLRTIAPWTRPERDAPSPVAPGNTAFVLVVLGSVVALGALARHNLRLGRGDKRGAMLLALAVFVGFSISDMLTGHWGLDAVHLWRSLLQQPYFPALAAWLFYLGMEPYLRRRWPHRLIAWTRLLEGRFADPLVGREILLGIAAAALAQIMVAASTLVVHQRDLDVLLLYNPLAGAAEFWGGISGLFSDAVMKGLGSLAVALIFWMVFRRDWIAWLGLFIISVLASLPTWHLAAPQWTGLVISAALLVLATRIGLLAAIVSWIALDLLQQTTPLTLDPSRWYAWRTAVIALLLLAFIAWGFRAVFGRRPLFSSAWLES